MASRREIKRRVRSITNTSQITKAMQLVAASRMRRAQARTAASRSYAEHIQGIVADLGHRSGVETHALLAQREVRSVEIIAVGPDRGLAGALVTNLRREILRVIRSGDHPVRVV